MRIVLERSGGLAGLRRASRLEGSELGPTDEERVREAAARAGFFGLPAELRASEPEPDRFTYRLEIEDGGRVLSVRFDESAASEALLDLLDLVRDLTGA
jgi:Emfourin